MMQRMPYGNRIPGIQFTEESIIPVVNGSDDTITCIIGTAKTGPTDPTIVSSTEDMRLLFDTPLNDDYGIKAANFILPNKVMYVRVLSKGGRAVFKDNAQNIFIAKEGGEHLKNAQLNIEKSDDKLTFTLSVGGSNLETIVCSSNELDSEYVFRVFDNYSSYLNLAVSSDYTFSSKILEATGGSKGASPAIGKVMASEEVGMEVQSIYPCSTLNGVDVHLLNDLNKKPYIKVIKNGVVIEEIPTTVSIESKDEFIERVNSSSDYIKIVALKDTTPKKVTLADGDGGNTSVTDDDFLDAIDKIADASIYRVDTLIIPGVTSSVVQSKAMNVCQNRGDTLFIADHPLGLKASLVRDFVKSRGKFSTHVSLNSDFVAMFSPWVLVNDGNATYYPPSIVGAKTLADNDKKHNIWDACAGVKRGVLNGISGLEYDPSKTDLDILYNDALVNPIVNITGKGFLIWGNKTLRMPVYKNAPEPLCSLNVRRLVNYLRKAIYDVTLPLVFEANDKFTWDTMSNLVCPILDKVKNGRGIDAYRFVCDETTNTSENIDSLTLTAILSIRPTRCAEYINIDLKIYPYTVAFEGEGE